MASNRGGPDTGWSTKAVRSRPTGPCPATGRPPGSTSTPRSWPWRPPPTARATGWWPADGGVFAFGDAAFYGSMGGQPLNAPVVGMVVDRRRQGLLAGGRGRRGLRLRRRRLLRLDGRPAAQRAGGRDGRHPDGKGYWLVAADGGVFAFGDATFEGSMGGRRLNDPVVGMAGAPDGHGYWWWRRRRGVLLRFGSVPRMRRPDAPQHTGGRHDGGSGNRRLLAGRLGRGIFASGAPFLGAGLSRPAPWSAPSGRPPCLGLLPSRQPRLGYDRLDFRYLPGREFFTVWGVPYLPG